MVESMFLPLLSLLYLLYIIQYINVLYQKYLKCAYKFIKFMNEPIFLHNKKVYEIFKEIAKSVPKNSQLFLVGGALRNSIFYHFFKKRLRQRDYDLVFMGNRKRFIDNLKKLKFTYGKLRRKNQVVLKKRKVDNPGNIQDYVVLDVSFYPKENINKILRKKVNFTVNGFALNIKNVFNKNWVKKLIKLPLAITDIKSKQLRLNPEKNTFWGTEIYACIRFMSAGFKKPSKNEIETLYQIMEKIPKYKFKRNKKKVFEYVGGKEKAKKIVKKMGLNKDVFSFNTILKLRH